MAQIKKKGTDRWKMPPYDTDFECPKCFATFMLALGDYFEVSDRNEDAIITECPSCRSRVHLPVVDAARVAEAMVVISYREYEYLTAIQRRTEDIAALLYYARDRTEYAEWTEMNIDEIKRAVGSVAVRVANALEAGLLDRTSRQQHEVEDKPNRLRRPTPIQPVASAYEDPLYSGFDPRGNVAPEIEEELLPEVVQGPRQGRGRGAVSVDQADGE